MDTGTESEKLRPQSVLRIRLIGAIALIICISSLTVGPASQQIERIRDTVSDIYQRVSPREIEDPDKFPAVVVEIDQATLDAVGPWPWPRTRIAELTERLFELNAQVVAFDIVFSEPDRFGGENLAAIYADAPDDVRQHLKDLPDADQRLITVVGAGENYVVLGRAGVANPKDGSPRDPATFPIDAEFDGEIPEGLQHYPSALTNIEDLDEVGLGHGLLNWSPDADGIVRRIPLVAMVGKRRTPSFALEILRVAARSNVELGIAEPGEPNMKPVPADAKIGLHVENERLRAVSLGHFKVPVEADGTMRLHFSKPVLGRTVSALSVLDGSINPALITRRLVIVGFTGVGIEDVVPTPLYSEVSGVEIHAQVIEAFLQEGWLQRPYWAADLELAGAILIGLLAIWGLPLLSPGRAVIWSLLATALVLSFSIGAFAVSGLVIDATMPLLGAGLPATITMSGILLSTERRRRELREIVLVEHARAEEARKIQFAMLPTLESLHGLPDAVDVWPVLEPAQSVGGDFYDAFMLDDRRLYFAVGDVTGKGVSAALFMAVVKALSKSMILRDSGDLESAVNEISREIARDNPDEMFATALLGVMDLETGQVSVCNAGHENPILIRKDGTVETWAMDGGPPFCVLEDFPYPVEILTIGPGDVLVIISDGVPEAWSPADELFGRERLAAAFDGLAPGRSSKEIVACLVDAVRRFEAGRQPVDDVTVMAIGYRRPDPT